MQSERKIRKDSVGQYLEEIKQFSSLSKEEEYDLVRRIKKGDKEARDILVTSKLQLVVFIARKYHSRRKDLDFLDLVQEGSIGLIIAAEKFDETLGFRFDTYAPFWIRQKIVRSIMGDSRTVRIPIFACGKIYQIKKIALQFFQEHGRDPLPEEIAEKMGMDVEDIGFLLAVDQSSVSLDSFVKEEDDSATRGEFFADENCALPEVASDQRILADTMKVCLQKLSEKQRKVLEMRYGLKDGIAHTLKEVGEELGMTHQGARSLEMSALRKIKKNKRFARLKDFASGE
jgi:RNA polymerase primary sigma factor